MKPKTIIFLIIAALFVIILFQNSDATSIQLLFWDLINIPLFALILFSLLIGYALGWFTHMAYQRGKKTAKSQLEPKKEEKKQAQRETPTESEETS